MTFNEDAAKKESEILDTAEERYAFMLGAHWQSLQATADKIDQLQAGSDKYANLRKQVGELAEKCMSLQEDLATTRTVLDETVEKYSKVVDKYDRLVDRYCKLIDACKDIEIGDTLLKEKP